MFQYLAFGCIKFINKQTILRSINYLFLHVFHVSWLSEIEHYFVVDNHRYIQNKVSNDATVFNVRIMQRFTESKRKNIYFKLSQLKWI